MKYEQKSFTVPASSAKSPADCKHGWWDQRMHCVLCGKDANDVAREKHEYYMRVVPTYTAGCE